MYDLEERANCYYMCLLMHVVGSFLYFLLSKIADVVTCCDCKRMRFMTEALFYALLRSFTDWIPVMFDDLFVFPIFGITSGKLGRVTFIITTFILLPLR